MAVGKVTFGHTTCIFGDCGKLPRPRSLLCEACRKRLWAARNRERVQTYRKVYRQANKDRLKEKDKQYYQNNRATLDVKGKLRNSLPKGREQRKAVHRKLRSMFSKGLFDYTFWKQGGKCAICARKDPGTCRGWSADHCHAANVPRGVLCQACNIGLGFYEKHQRPAGLVIEPYERYLANPPVGRLET